MIDQPSHAPSRTLLRIALACAAFCAVERCPAGDLGVTPLLDGERTGVLGTNPPEFRNNWGGTMSPGNLSALVRDASVAHGGAASIRADLGTIAPGGFGFFQAFSSGPHPTSSFRQTRDLTRYDSFDAYVRNDTGEDFNLKLEVKDYRDNGSHQAHRTFNVPTGGGWMPITGSFDFGSPEWTIVGSPDLSRAYVTSFVVTPQAGSVSGVSGSMYLDDFTLRESGGPIDLQTAPIATIAERLAERQFSGLWSARNRTSGLIYNSSDTSSLAALNTTAGVLWMAPAAVRRGWITQAQADAMAGQVAASLNTNLNQTTAGQTRYVPTRFVTPVTGGRPNDGVNEESSIDASFMALALHHYKSQPTTSPALTSTLNAVQNRFRLDDFAVAGGFRLAYKPGEGFTSGTYDGYTNEGKVISLAAEVSTDNHVPLENLWNSDDFRSRVHLVKQDDAHLVHTFSQFRAPFEQALLNLFVDTSDRGVDNFPVRSLATNPWQNYLRYEKETAAKLDELNRDSFFQPDAGLGGVDDPQDGVQDNHGGYQQYSMYEDFGQENLFMPWSVSLALLAGADGAEEALRLLLDTDMLNGPLGLADSARWDNGDLLPTNVPAAQDNWNVVLSTMALLEYLDGDDSASRFFADLAGVSAALDGVFVEGDVNGNGITNAADLAIWEAGFGDAAGATPANGDVTGDGAVDGADFLHWQRGLGSTGAATAADTAVPEPASWIGFAGLVVVAVAARVRRAV